MATSNTNKTTLPNAYSADQERNKNWANRLAMAMMLGKSNPSTIGGYVIGSMFQKPFQAWMDKLWGVPKSDNSNEGENNPSPPISEADRMTNLQNYALQYFNQNNYPQEVGDFSEFEKFPSKSWQAPSTNWEKLIGYYGG